MRFVFDFNSLGRSYMEGLFKRKVLECIFKKEQNSPVSINYSLSTCGLLPGEDLIKAV